MDRNKPDAAELIRRIKLGPGPGSNTSEVLFAAIKLLLPRASTKSKIIAARIIAYNHGANGAYIEACDVIREALFNRWGFMIMNGRARKVAGLMLPEARGDWKVSMSPPAAMRPDLKGVNWPAATNRDLPRAYLHALLIAEQIRKRKNPVIW